VGILKRNVSKVRYNEELKLAITGPRCNSGNVQNSMQTNTTAV
jgi:hypothetical protein